MGNNKVVLGLQWGDEGKGKVIEVLAGDADFVVRCQGGANAGHTVVVGDKKTILHLLPSGALHENAQCIIGNGVVVDPLAVVDELADLGPVGEELTGRLLISDRAHLVLPCHKALDAAIEERKGDRKAGTTMRGIGPCYTDKVARIGLRAGALRDLTEFQKLVREHSALINSQLQAWGHDGLDCDAMLSQIMPACEQIAPLIADTADLLHKGVAADKTMLFEGAQGVMLDIDYGTYPYVTSSNTGVGGVVTGSGVSHKELHDVIGIVKAYTTRVGTGPFPVELLGEKGDEIRERGGEFGATTGRPRRCGWLDLVVVGFACRLNGVDNIALTKLDVLTGEKDIPVCVAYELNGERIDTMPADAEDLADAKPIYETCAGWTEDISGIDQFDQLPQAAQDYVAFIEQRTGARVGYIGTGPGRAATIIR